jgi:hypothetical protein
MKSVISNFFKTDEKVQEEKCPFRMVEFVDFEYCQLFMTIKVIGWLGISMKKETKVMQLPYSAAKHPSLI